MKTKITKFQTFREQIGLHDLRYVRRFVYLCRMCFAHTTIVNVLTDASEVEVMWLCVCVRPSFSRFSALSTTQYTGVLRAGRQAVAAAAASSSHHNVELRHNDTNVMGNVKVSNVNKTNYDRGEGRKRGGGGGRQMYWSLGDSDLRHTYTLYTYTQTHTIVPHYRFTLQRSHRWHVSSNVHMRAKQKKKKNLFAQRVAFYFYFFHFGSVSHYKLAWCPIFGENVGGGSQTMGFYLRKESLFDSNKWKLARIRNSI